MVGLLKILDQQVRQQIDLDARLTKLLDQLRNDVSRIDNDPIHLESVPGADPSERTSDHADVERGPRPAYEAVAVMLAVAGSSDEFRLERLRASFHQLWQRMEGAFPAFPSTAFIDLRDDIRH